MFHLTDIFRKLLTDSFTALFLRKSLLERRNIPRSFAFLFYVVINSTLCFKSSLSSFLDTSPLSANNFLKRSLVRCFITFRLRSSALPGVRQKLKTFPQSLITRWSSFRFSQCLERLCAAVYCGCRIYPMLWSQ